MVSTINTIGFNVETVEYQNIKLEIWDIGGLDKIRPLWKHYLPCSSLVYFIDSNDKERL